MFHPKYFFLPQQKPLNEPSSSRSLRTDVNLFVLSAEADFSPPSDRRIGGFVSGGTLRDVAHAAQQAGNRDSQSKQNRSAGTSRGSAAITHRLSGQS